MSSDYASRLSLYENKGVCGLPERLDRERVLRKNTRRLVEKIRKARSCVVLTGAGISTAAGIRDFRGPRGIWTEEQQTKKKKKKKGQQNARNKRKRKDAEEEEEEGVREKDNGATGPPPPSAPDTTFAEALPTLTHRAIVELVRLQHCQFVVTQNVDGLHQRSGLSRRHLAVLHGCLFTEFCPRCRTEYFRDEELQTIRFQPTGRSCGTCWAPLRDTLLDWEDALPNFDWARAQQHCDRADLVLALGTSLRIEPAGSLPARAREFVICNLQPTPYDRQASFVIRQRVDLLMDEVLTELTQNPNWDRSRERATIERTWVRPQSPPESEDDDEEENGEEQKGHDDDNEDDSEE